MEFSRGPVLKPVTAVAHGVEGVGKSLFGSLWPRPFFIDPERSSLRLNVARTCPDTWTGLMMSLDDLHKNHQEEFDTVVIDTADWADRLGVKEVCAENGFSALGGQEDYGHSYNLLETKFCTMLDQLTYMNEQGWNVLILAHSQVVKIQQPEEIGAYDKWELACNKKISKKLKEWPEMLLFLNYRTLVVEDRKTKTKKGTGGQRVAYSQHSPCWDAKCRLAGVPAEFDFEAEFDSSGSLIRHQGWETIKHLFAATEPAKVPHALPRSAPENRQEPAKTAPAQEEARPPLRKLMAAMQQSAVTWEQVLSVIVQKGHFPKNTPMKNLPDDYIEGRLIPAIPNIAKALKGDAA